MNNTLKGINSRIMEADCQIIWGNGALGASHGKFGKQRELFYLLLSNSKWLWFRSGWP